MQTEYATCYRRLIEVTRTNGIRLVLANYSMAVNRQSDSDVVEIHPTQGSQHLLEPPGQRD